MPSIWDLPDEPMPDGLDARVTPHSRAYAWCTWCTCPVCTFHRIDQRESDRRQAERTTPDRRQPERPSDGTDL